MVDNEEDMDVKDELEIKAESLRYIVCSTRDLLEDSSVNVETVPLVSKQDPLGRLTTCTITTAYDWTPPF